MLEPALDPEKPNERVIDLLAELQMKAGKLDEAERLYELARSDDPSTPSGSPAWRGSTSARRTRPSS